MILSSNLGQFKVMSEKFKKPKRFPLTGPLDVDDYKTYVTKSRTDFYKLINLKWVEDAEFSDFVVKRQIGSGSFGTVYLVNYKKNGTLLAMKTLEKAKIVKVKQVVNTKREMDYMKCLIYPFTIHLEHFFKDNCNLYFMLPFISGGELYHHLKKLGNFNEQQARFLAGQIVLAIEYLHSLDILYRDLKPENILIDHTGYIKLADFGFSKIVTSRTYTMCGTPEYMAPEIILNEGYGPAADWWAVGVLMYELVDGKTPFFNKNMLQIYENITTGKYEMPGSFSTELKDLVTNILQVDLTRRYGNLAKATKDIKDHKWFSKMDWLSLFNRKVTALYLPCEMPKDGHETDIKSIFSNSSKDVFKCDFDDF